MNGAGSRVSKMTTQQKIQDCLQHMRTTASGALIGHAIGDPEACTLARPVMQEALNGLSELWTDVVEMYDFRALKQHVESSKAIDYSRITDAILPRLEKAFERSGKAAAEFTALLDERVIAASMHHYQDGDFREAVLNGMMALAEAIRVRTGLQGDGVQLCSVAFKPEEPLLVFSENQSIIGRDDQQGFHKIMLGAFQGIRNPKAHSLAHDLTATSAAQYLVFISLLIRRVDEATRPAR